MPRDLFGEVTAPSIKLGSRKWYTVPLSLTVHTVIVALLVIAPLLATSTLPIPNLRTVFVPIAAPPLPEPPRVPPPTSPAERVVSRDAAPVTAPAEIRPEIELPPPFEGTTTIDAGIVLGSQIDGSAVTPPPPVVTPPPAAPVRVGGQIRTPERVTYVAPEYPPLARAAGVQGLVIIEATIDANGRVHSARVLRSDSPLLDEAALSAVRQWVYTPTLLNGVPVSVVMTVTVQFRLR